LGRRILAAIGIAAALLAGVLARPAGSATNPPAFLFLAQSPGPAGTETLVAILPTGGDTLPAASVSIYVPTGYGLTLNSPPGTKIGNLTALGGSEVPDITVANPAANTTDPCAPGLHAAVWEATLNEVAPQPVVVHVYVDPTTGDETARGAYRITYCQSAALFFLLEGVVTPPTAAGDYTWRAFVTPQPPAGAQPDPNSVYELRAIVPVPHVIRAKATYVAKIQTLVVSGKVTAGTAGEANSEVEVGRRKGSKISVVGTVKTRADGSFTVKKVVRETKSPQTLNLFVLAQVRPLGLCTAPPLAPAGCLSQTSDSTSSTFTARIPKKPAPKPKPKKH